MGTIQSKVCYIRLGQVKKAVSLCVLAQKFMPIGKRCGAIVWGQSGIGKNGVTDTLAEDFAKATKRPWQMVDCNVSACSPEDITGLPQIVNGITVDRPRFSFDKDSFGIFRLDEMDRPAYRQNLVAMVKYCIDRTVDKPLPLNWFVLGLANGISDEDTQPLTEHLKGRFVHLYVSMNSSQAQKDVQDFIATQSLPSAIKRLYAMNPLVTRDEFEELAVYNNRSVVYAGAILSAYEGMKKAGADYSDVLLPVLAGAIGKAAAVELIKLHDLQGLPTLEDVISNPFSSMIPEDLSLRHKYITALVHEAQSDCAKAADLVHYLVRLPDEVARYALEILATACPEVSKTDTYITWQNRT